MQLDVHAPHEAESESVQANWHAHLLITTRRLEGERFAVKKARDLDPELRRAGGRALVADASRGARCGATTRTDIPGARSRHPSGPDRDAFRPAHRASAHARKAGRDRHERDVHNGDLWRGCGESSLALVCAIARPVRDPHDQIAAFRCGIAIASFASITLRCMLGMRRPKRLEQVCEGKRWRASRNGSRGSRRSTRSCA